MGLAESLMRAVFGGGEDDIPDPDTGLTKRQRMLIASSWEVLYKNKKENGVAFFIMLFKTFPPLQNLFQQLKDKSLEELQKAPVMRAHATTVMHSISSLVENVDDKACLVSLIRKIGKNHLDRGVPVGAFEDLRKMFGAFLDDRCGGSCPEETKKAWDIFLSVMNTIIEQQAKEMGVLKE